ncbi:ABC transporter permease [Staphylococcus felis]|uniref:ABC transporter permease n=1 Tax=Staphylococcus felis TaxID=46127 RepID=UPI000E220686|nr:ABC transporter permease [Staphylococcus felis]REI04150.1 ABC transporter permease [Staphylococcus felis]
MKSLFVILHEQISNWKTIIQLAVYNMKSQYSNHYLGVFWNIIQPLMQVGVYYLIFGLGLRGGGDRLVDGAPFIIHLISGLFPWLFISQSINQGANAIQANLGLVTKMKFPSSVLLSISFTNTLFNLCFMTSILFVISLIQGYVPLWKYLLFIYFIIAAFPAIFGISLLMSSLVIVVRDTKNLLQNILRLGFFMTPIFWGIQSVQPVLQHIARLNPFTYLVEIYRSVFVHSSPILYGSFADHFYYWMFTLFILTLGAMVHERFKNRLLDFL